MFKQQTLTSPAQCWNSAAATATMTMRRRSRRRWRMASHPHRTWAMAFLPPLPLTCTLLACRLGRCWEPRRLKMKTSRLRSCPCRGKSIHLRPESHLKLKITLGLDSTGGCYGWMAPYVCGQTPKRGARQETRRGPRFILPEAAIKQI